MDYSRYDDKVKEIIKSCERLSVSGDPAAIEQLDILRMLAEASNDTALLGYAEFYTANWYYDRPDTLKYHEHLKQAVYHLLRCNEGELLARAYNLFALDAYSNEVHDVAYHYYNAAIRFAEKGDNPGAVAPMVGNLAILYYEIEDYDYAREYCRRGMELAENFSGGPYYLHNMLGGYINDGMISMRLGELSEAQAAYEKAKSLYRQIDTDLFKDASIAFTLFELQLMLAEREFDGFDEEFEGLTDMLAYDEQPHAYISDIKDFCKDLLEYGMTDKVEELIMSIEDKVMESGITHAIRILYEIKVDYNDAIQNEKNLDICLREQQKLMRLQRKEKMRIYNYSTQLIDIVLNL